MRMTIIEGERMLMILWRICCCPTNRTRIDAERCEPVSRARRDLSSARVRTGNEAGCVLARSLYTQKYFLYSVYEYNTAPDYLESNATARDKLHTCSFPTLTSRKDTKIMRNGRARWCLRQGPRKKMRHLEPFVLPSLLRPLLLSFSS